MPCRAGRQARSAAREGGGVEHLKACGSVRARLRPHRSFAPPLRVGRRSASPRDRIVARAASPRDRIGAPSPEQRAVTALRSRPSCDRRAVPARCRALWAELDALEMLSIARGNRSYWAAARGPLGPRPQARPRGHGRGDCSSCQGRGGLTAGLQPAAKSLSCHAHLS